MLLDTRCQMDEPWGLYEERHNPLTNNGQIQRGRKQVGGGLLFIAKSYPKSGLEIFNTDITFPWILEPNKSI